MRRAPVVVGTLLVGLALALPGLAAGHTVQAVNYEFIAPGGGASLTVVVGDTVTWEAAGDPHTVTSGTPGAIDDRFPDRPAAEGFLLAGSSFTTTFNAAGTYPYFCEVHFETMTGTVVVVAAATPAPTKAPTPPPTPRPTPTPTPARTPVATPVSTPAASPDPTTVEASPSAPSPSRSSRSSPTPGGGADASPSPSATPLPTGPGPDAEPGAGPGALPIAVAGIAAAGLVGGLLLARRRRPGADV
ncbi:MAG: plastocyanin/azurin family copper-binding protein [Chloroflexi bacterium]|nr:plastocyanin/azurin family copper-binding protein [Chloroflexota bacterium]